MRDLRAKSNFTGSARLLASVLILASTSALLAKGLPLALSAALILFNGYILAGFFSGMHFAAHGTLFASRALNGFAGRFYALPLLMNYSAYKYFHLQHHRATGVAGDSEPAGSFHGLGHYIFSMTNWDYLYAFNRLGIASFAGYAPFFVTRKSQLHELRLDSILNGVWLAGVVALTVLWPQLVFKIYFLPLQVALSANFFLVIGEHFACEPGGDVLQTTRTFSPQGWLFGFFHYHANYHAAHHVYPSLPPWNIPSAHAALAPRLQHPPIGYLAVNREIFGGMWKTQRIAPVAEGREPSFLYRLRKIQ